MEENKAQRLKAQESSGVDEESNTVLDNLIEKLRNGESIRKGKKPNRQDRPRSSVPITLSLETGDQTGDAGDVARDMLARLQGDGFVMPPSPLPPSTSSQRRERRRRERPTLLGEKEIPPSPLASEILDINEESVSEVQASDTDEPVSPS
jgi:cytokinesis protein